MEGSDEPFHYGYIEQVRRGGGFPDPTRAPQNLAEYESSQAPLYYLTAAAILQLVPGIPAWDGETPPLNRWFGGQPVKYRDNKNLYLHNFDDPDEWFQGVARGVRVARLVATFYGAIAVLAAYLVTREITHGVSWLPLLTGSMIAFNPQFIQASAVVENDTSAAAFMGLTLWRLTRIVRYRPDSLGEYALAGLFAGLAVLGKSSALIAPLLVLIGLVLTWWPERRVPRWSAWLPRACAALGMLSIIGGWWYLRNWLLYSDPLRSSAYDRYPWMYPEPHSLWTLLPDVPRSLLSFWADLGYSGDIRPTGFFYSGVGLIALLAVIGLGRYLLGGHTDSQRGLRDRRLLLLVVCSGLLTIAMYVRLQQTFSFAWGRHLFPSATAFGVLLGVGVFHVCPRCARLTGQGVAAFLAAYAFLIPPLVLLPNYLPPRVAEFPVLTERLDWNYGSVVTLIGYQIGDRTLYAGEDTIVKLCWETLSVPSADYAFALHLVAPDGSVVGARDSYHGLGRYPSSAWRAGDHFCDRVRVGVSAELAPAQLYQMLISVYDPDTLEPLPVTDSAGAPAPTFAGWLKAPAATQLPPDAVEVGDGVRFGEAISLAAYSLEAGPTTRIILYWKVFGTPGGDLAVFVQMIDEAGNIVAQADSHPREGRYPTWLWESGEIVEDAHTFDSTPETGRYRILIGLYDPATGLRLPLIVDGQPVAGDAVTLPAEGAFFR